MGLVDGQKTATVHGDGGRGRACDFLMGTALGNQNSVGLILIAILSRGPTTDSSIMMSALETGCRCYSKCESDDRRSCVRLWGRETSLQEVQYILVAFVLTSTIVFCYKKNRIHAASCRSQNGSSVMRTIHSG
jgi:hypothetical protein